VFRGSGFPYCRYFFGTDFTDYTVWLRAFLWGGGQAFLIVVVEGQRCGKRWGQAFLIVVIAKRGYE